MDTDMIEKEVAEQGDDEVPVPEGPALQYPVRP